MDNQTDSVDLANVAATDKGTGIFLIPAVHEIAGTMNKEIVAEITYGECISRGQFAFAFKWIPNSVESESSLSRANCGVHLCVKTCNTRGCICNMILGRCQ